MKRKVIIAIILVLLIFIISIVTIPAIANLGESFSKYMKWGEIDSAIDGKGIDFIKSDKIAITNDYVNATYVRCSTTDDEGSFKRALMYQFKRRALYQKAMDLGYTITDEEVWAKVNQAKEWAARAVNRNELDAYIAGLGMTWDEYWDAQFEDYKISWLPNEYYNKLRNEFFNGNPSEYYFNQEKADAYDIYIDQIKTTALLEYGVTETYVDSIVALYADGIPSGDELKAFVAENKLEVLPETAETAVVLPDLPIIGMDTADSAEAMD